MPLIAKTTLLSVAVTFNLIFAQSAFAQSVGSERLQEVTRRGRHVMPFSLEQTQHVFTKTETGGVQQVIARDSGNRRQIELIRQHLTKISKAFSRGDFSDPAKIHGEDMPGLTELRQAEAGRLQVRYQTLDNGAEVTYFSEDARLIDAVHRWFDAQLADHGPDATTEHPHGAMHKMYDMKSMQK